MNNEEIPSIVNDIILLRKNINTLRVALEQLSIDMKHLQNYVKENVEGFKDGDNRVQRSKMDAL